MTQPIFAMFVVSTNKFGRQTKGLFWKEGGPIIGVQIENEYHERGPGKGPEHMLTLLRIAHEAGLDAPFYTATGWDAAEVPQQQFLPVFGGYADAFLGPKFAETTTQRELLLHSHSLRRKCG